MQPERESLAENTELARLIDKVLNEGDEWSVDPPKQPAPPVPVVTINFERPVIRPVRPVNTGRPLYSYKPPAQVYYRPPSSLLDHTGISPKTGEAEPQKQCVVPVPLEPPLPRSRKNVRVNHDLVDDEDADLQRALEASLVLTADESIVTRHRHNNDDTNTTTASSTAGHDDPFNDPALSPEERETMRRIAAESERERQMQLMEEMEEMRREWHEEIKLKQSGHRVNK